MPTSIMPDKPDEPVLDTTFREAQEILRVSRSTLYRIMERSAITCRKVGTTWRFSREELRSEKVFQKAPIPKVA